VSDAVTGLPALLAALEDIPIKLERNILRGALRAGAKVQLQEAQRDCPAETGGPHPGALRDSLRITTSARGSTVRAQVKAGGPKAFWAKFVEFGTAAHLIKPKNKKSLFFAAANAEVVHHPGAKKRPFMRPALDNTQRTATEAVAAYMQKRFTKEGINVPSET
jgi:HK97 gp10 family phage protein